MRAFVAGTVLLAAICLAQAVPRCVATALNPPGAISTKGAVINAHGDIVGNFRTADAKYLTFSHVDGVDAVLDQPGRPRRDELLPHAAFTRLGNRRSERLVNGARRHCRELGPLP